jgi:hypothetical protein
MTLLRHSWPRWRHLWLHKTDMGQPRVTQAP